ncbi:MAG TPA: RDD family protein [Thermoanaerobaculia bacterium]|jgi:uncharacterized RDD family membrane protein YckC|nr:RDD family protein [Thermoanaerobaculia bacterium]
MSANVGVIYATKDYLGVGKRLLIDVVDTMVATVASSLLTLLLIMIWPWESTGGLAVLLLLSSIWFAYFVLLKRSRFRTLGYRLAGAKIVNLQGETPSIGSLLIRLLFVVGGPANVVFDLFWIPSDENRQAIRDKFAHTYVVRTAALPTGSGPLVYRTYNMLGTTFYFLEIRRDVAAKVPPG